MARIKPVKLQMLQLQWAAPLNLSVMWQWSLTIFTATINEFFTNLANVTRLKLFFFFIHDQGFVKVFFHYFFTILILFKNHFNKFISSIFISKNNCWLSKFIINKIKLVSKTTRNVILIFFLNKNLRNFQHFLN